MKPTARILLLSAISSLPVVAAPFLAIGDNAELYLTASTQVRYEDNVGLASDALKQDDFIYELTPGLELVYGKKGNLKSRLNVYEQFVRYTDLSNLNAELLNIVLDSTYTGAKLSVDAEASYRQLNQNDRGTAGAVNQRRDVTNGMLNSEYAFTAKTKAGLGFQYDETQHKNVVFRDYHSFAIPVNYFYGITPKIDLSAGFRYRQTKVDAPNLDSEDMNFNIGSRGEFTAKLSGRVHFGYTQRESDAGADDGMIAVGTGLTYQYSPKTEFTLDVNSDFGVSANGQTEKNFPITLGAKTQFTEAFSGSASLRYSHILYKGSREDDFIAAALGFSYTVNQHIGLSLTYSHENNGSNFVNSEYSANIVSFAANFRY